MKHMADGLKEKDAINLDGGGLIRSAGGIPGVLERQRSNDYERADERVLGDGDFVSRVLKDQEKGIRDSRALSRAGWDKSKTRILEQFKISPSDLLGGMRGRSLSKAREALVYVGLKHLGKTGESLAEELNKTRGAVTKAYHRARGWIKGDEPWLGLN